MKHLVVIIVLMFSQTLFAKTPECVDYDVDPEAEEVYPCFLSKKEQLHPILNMMLENRKGVRMVQTSGENGLIMDDFMDGEVATIVTMLSFTDNEEGMKSTMRYEFYLYDCRGTDVCSDRYKWTVDQETVGDGYTYESTYKNKVEKLGPGEI